MKQPTTRVLTGRGIITMWSSWTVRDRSSPSSASSTPWRAGRNLAASSRRTPPWPWRLKPARARPLTSSSSMTAPSTRSIRTVPRVTGSARFPAATRPTTWTVGLWPRPLRMDGQHWKSLHPLDPLTQQLQLLCRDEIGLIEQRTALVNQLQQALHEYYPAALAAFEDWTKPFCWDFVIQFPTPGKLAAAGSRRWEKFLHSQKLWRGETAPKRLEIFKQAAQFCGSPAVVAAKSLLATSLAHLLKVLEAQLEHYRRQIEALFKQHPDSGLFGSLPGAAQTLAPRLLGEIGGDPGRFEDTENLQCVAGTAPVSYQSGQIHRVRIRFQCNKVLRHTVHLWAGCCLRACPWAEIYYKQKRQEGKSHACALRCLGQRLLKILWRMIQTRTPYDPDLHAKNQQAHGSWVLQLIRPTAKTTP